MITLLLTFALSLVGTVLATFWVRLLGFRLGVVDEPDGVRRLHGRTVPRVGGWAVFLGSALALVAPRLLGVGRWWLAPETLFTVLPLLAGGAAVFALGLLDDIRDLRARTKFVAEVVIASGIFAAGVRIGAVSVGDLVLFELPPAVDYVATVVWFVGLANAFNLIDGHDGVAGGVALLALATISYAAVQSGNAVVAVPALSLSGAVLGFLLFNLPPATVFLGDGGSLFLGFALAGLGLLSVQGAPGEPLPILVPVLALGLPVLDTSLAIARRFLRKDRVFSPDRGHIHHRLRDMGYSRTLVTLVMWGLAAVFSLTSVVLLTYDPLLTAVALTLAATVSLLTVRWLEAPEFMELGRAVQRVLLQRRSIAQNVRVRDAVRLLRSVNSAEGLHDALRHAFRDSHADHIEVWVPGEWEAVLSADPHFKSESFGLSWREGRDEVPELWEITVKLELATPKVGRLSLRYADPKVDALSHVDAVVRKLGPALCDALDRLLSVHPRKEPPAEESSGERPSRSLRQPPA